MPSTTPVLLGGDVYIGIPATSFIPIAKIKRQKNENSNSERFISFLPYRPPSGYGPDFGPTDLYTSLK